MSESPIRAGTRVLDSLYPHWYDAIELDDLDLKSGVSCVLGQLYGSYSEGVSRVAGFDVYSPQGSDWAKKHGFTLPGKAPWTMEKWGDLTARWKRAIRRRRAKAAS